MDIISMGIWEILLNMAALTLCGITVLYIAGKRRTVTARPIPDNSEERIQSIVEKNFNRLIHQDPARAFNRVIASVTKTQSVRKPHGAEMISTGARPRPQADRPANRKRKPVKAPGRVHTVGGKTLDTKPMRVYQFTASGMSVKKISEKLQMPRCEVELIAKFQQHENRRAAVL